MSTYFLLIFAYLPLGAIRRFSCPPYRRKQKTSEVFIYGTGHQIAIGLPIELGHEEGQRLRIEKTNS